MVRYSVAICNYNMAETLERSLVSILDQVGEAFEVVVVDGGSDDGSVDRLASLADRYTALRVVELDPDPGRKLGADRQRAVEEARGDYVLPQLDVDDVYAPVIEDFVELYEQLAAGLDFEFFLSGTGINVAPRSLLETVPYRNLQSAEDRDLWRRLLAEDAIVWLDHEPVRREVGYEKTPVDHLRRDFTNKVADARCGLTLSSCLAWSLSPGEHFVLEQRRGPLGQVSKSLFDLATYPVAFGYAAGNEPFETPPEFRRKGRLEEAIAEVRGTVAEIERRYDVEVDRSRLSEDGRRLLCKGES